MLDRSRGLEVEMASHPTDATRRGFLKATGAALVGVAAGEGSALASATPEGHVATLFESLTPEQRAVVTFPWNHQDLIFETAVAQLNT